MLAGRSASGSVWTRGHSLGWRANILRRSNQLPRSQDVLRLQQGDRGMGPGMVFLNKSPLGSSLESPAQNPFSTKMLALEQVFISIVQWKLKLITYIYVFLPKEEQDVYGDQVNVLLKNNFRAQV